MGALWTWRVFQPDDFRAAEAHFKPKIELPGVFASAVQKLSMVKVMDWERHGDVQSSAVPPGHELPLTDLLEFGVGLQSPGNRSGWRGLTNPTDNRLNGHLRP
jgi:hypothetical protein